MELRLSTYEYNLCRSDLSLFSQLALVLLLGEVELCEASFTCGYCLIGDDVWGMQSEPGLVHVYM